MILASFIACFALDKLSTSYLNDKKLKSLKSITHILYVIYGYWIFCTEYMAVGMISRESISTVFIPSACYYVHTLIPLYQEKQYELLLHHFIAFYFYWRAITDPYQAILDKTILLLLLADFSTLPMLLMFAAKEHQWNETIYKSFKILFTISFVLIRSIIIPIGSLSLWLDFDLFIQVFVLLFLLMNAFWSYKVVRGFCKGFFTEINKN